jgi:hypothetical protein
VAFELTNVCLVKMRIKINGSLNGDLTDLHSGNVGNVCCVFISVRSASLVFLLIFSDTPLHKNTDVTRSGKINNEDAHWTLNTSQ